MKKPIPLLFSLAVLSIAFLPCAVHAKNTMEIVYKDGSRQSVNLDQPASNISKIDYRSADNGRNPKKDRGAGIDVISASYGLGSRTCDAYRHVSRECDGKFKCSFRATNFMCGDPAVGKKKELVVKFTCSGAEKTARAVEDRYIIMRCD